MASQQTCVPCSACFPPCLSQHPVPYLGGLLQRHHGRFKGHEAEAQRTFWVPACVCQCGELFSDLPKVDSCEREVSWDSYTQGPGNDCTKCLGRCGAGHFWHAAHRPRLHASLLCSESQRLMAANSTFRAPSPTGCWSQCGWGRTRSGHLRAGKESPAPLCGSVSHRTASAVIPASVQWLQFLALIRLPPLAGSIPGDLSCSPPSPNPCTLVPSPLLFIFSCSSCSFY